METSILSPLKTVLWGAEKGKKWQRNTLSQCEQRNSGIISAPPQHGDGMGRQSKRQICTTVINFSESMTKRHYEGQMIDDLRCIDRIPFV
jgi:hypothetical protein